MISLKTPEQIKLMREAGRITGEAIMLAGEQVKPGVTTKHLVHADGRRVPQIRARHRL